jgi:peptidyl-prolyl cis-trans isomerase C
VQPPTEAQRRQVRSEVLGLIINDVLMRQFLRKNGPKVEPVDVDKQVADFTKSLEQQKPPRTLQDFYRETGQTEEQVRSNITRMLQWMAYVKAHVKDDDIKAYYGQSKDFFDQVAVRASHIVFRVAPDAPEAERKATRDKLTALRDEIVAGKLDFAEAAKKHSQCPSAPGGGDIGFFSRKGMLDENFAKAAYALKADEVSDIVTTDFGLHLIKVTDRKPGKPSDFEKIKDEVRDFYVEELRQNLLMQERKNAKIEINIHE